MFQARWFNNLLLTVKKRPRLQIALIILCLCLLGVALWVNVNNTNSDKRANKKRICFVYQELETGFWVAGHKIITKSLQSQKAQVITYDAHKDANLQLQQVKNCINQRVDGIILIPVDGDSAISIIGAANNANIPIGVFNRPPSSSNPNAAIIVVSNNKVIAEDTVQFMTQQAMKRAKKAHPLILVGDLGDPNAIERKQGFNTVIARYPDLFAPPVYLNTRWNASATLSGLQEVIQNNPEIDFIFTSSDFLYPQIKAVLEPLGKWKPRGEVGHIILGGVDGDQRACELMKQGYVEATGVQDLFSEAHSLTTALLKAIERKQGRQKQVIQDTGFTLTQDNLATRAKDMWGCSLPAPQKAS